MIFDKSVKVQCFLHQWCLINSYWPYPKPLQCTWCIHKYNLIGICWCSLSFVFTFWVKVSFFLKMKHLKLFNNSDSLTSTKTWHLERKKLYFGVGMIIINKQWLYKNIIKSYQTSDLIFTLSSKKKKKKNLRHHTIPGQKNKSKILLFLSGFRWNLEIKWYTSKRRPWKRTKLDL